MSDLLLGLHHVTAMTDDIRRNYHFMTEVLSMRLVKKTVNQDDISTYHTFYADDQGHSGTDVTFFDFSNQSKGVHGTNSISRIGLRVPSDQALEFYQQRFKEYQVEHSDIYVFRGAKVLDFQEEDGQRYRLYSDENDSGVKPGEPWKSGPVDPKFAIYGLGPAEITVDYYDEFKHVLETVYQMKLIEETSEYALYEMGEEGGHGAQLILKNGQGMPAAIPGDGLVHHVAFRVVDEKALQGWLNRYRQYQVINSGIVERYFFKALYARIGHILIELATDGPGFMGDESYETLGEKLSLPPFLEAKREQIEKVVKPFNTKR